VAESCEHDHGPSGSIKGEKFLSDFQLRKKVSVPSSYMRYKIFSICVINIPFISSNETRVLRKQIWTLN